VAEVLSLYDNQLNLEKLASKDPNFRKRFGKDLESLAKILREVRIKGVEFDRAINQLHVKLRDLDSFNLPKRNLANLQKLLHNWLWLQIDSQQGIERCRIPPKKVIAKGYTDKGSARNLAVDGSPKWQEIALADVDYLQSLQKLRQLTAKAPLSSTTKRSV